MIRLPLVLASRSPRRSELLRMFLDEAAPGRDFDVVPAAVDESTRPDERPRDLVHRLALTKARTVASRVVAGAVVIGSDTTVELDGESLGTPTDPDDAKRMLRRLSGRTHLVHTGVAVVRGDIEASGVDTARVTLMTLTEDVVDWYVATGEPMDKAGAYGVQGRGAALVERVDGAVTTVVGLPLRLLAEYLAASGWT